MNRCAICDISDEDNPKAGISLYAQELDNGVILVKEFRCLECQNQISENLEDLNIGDEDFEFSV